MRVRSMRIISLRFLASSGPALFKIDRVYLDTAFQYEIINPTLNEFPEVVWKQSFSFYSCMR